MDFNTFDFHPQIAKGIVAAGYVSPTPIQAQAIPSVLAGRDVMGLAQTGTGKTAAFALPILQRLIKGSRGGVRALVVAPTRELAEQIHQAISDLGAETGLRSMTIYGGVNIRPQITALKRGVDIVVACPGRLIDHIGQGTIDLSKVEALVLDEADQMFDMGFFPAIRRILQNLPKKRQTLLFSATMPDEIRRLSAEVLFQPVTVQVGNTAPAETVSHALYPVAQHQKTAMLLELLSGDSTESVLVFTRTKHRAKRLGLQLDKAGYRAASLQGNLSQSRRQEALSGFRDGKYQVLVATDIAARGIDVSQVSHVINYDIPDTPEAYVHRIGRTGRASRKGDAYTLVSGEDNAMVRAIEKVLKAPIERRTIDGFDYNAPAPPRAADGDRDNAARRTPRGGKSSKPAAGKAGGQARRQRSSSSAPSRSNSSRGRKPAQ
ncbi:MAG: DEAD/DEAH box helicase [Pedobacter sp.]